MTEDPAKIKKRLDSIWESPNFASFFESYSKRTPINIKKGSIIFYEGDQPDRLYFLKEGFIKMYHSSEEGRDAIIYLFGPGSLLGVRALTSEDRALRHNAEAITDAKIISISRRDYLNLLAEHPEHLVDLLHIFISRLNYTERKLEGFILADTTARVANFLYDTATRFGRKRGKEVLLPIPFTHQLVAEFVGAFRETVTNSLNKLAKENIIKIERSKIIILSVSKLKKQARSSKIK